jgi:hypothetical protein
MNKSSTLILKKENYRLWFEFYKLCRLSIRTDVKLNLKKSEEFYKSWGDVTNIKFDDWWKTHDYLFQEPIIKVLDDISQRQTSDSLIIEVPLNLSTSNLVDTLKKLIEENQKPSSKKKKIKFKGIYQLTDNSELRFKTMRNKLNIYRDVYLVNRRPSIPKLLPMVVEYYKSKKRMKIPTTLDETTNDLSNIIKSLGRWMKDSEQIMLNVSNGEFPGKY